ncbi:MAG: MBL fold metallo-hydrolase [Ktedonobacterales bacterium]|nr:MBL fold metallo-hydrolase [Ktedonobacterales bacterium]
MEILPGVHRVANAVSTAYVLVDPRDGLTIIDAGPGHFERTVLRYLTQIGRRPDEVRRIILTHRHFDHIGGARGLRDATHARVLAHPLDAPQIDGSVPNAYPKGAMGAAMRVAVPLLFPFRPCPVDEMLVDGQSISLGELGELRVMLTPGHTLGHCALHLPARRLLIMGDALNNATGTPVVSFDAVNDDTAMANRTSIALEGMDVDALVFGHGKPVLQGAPAALKHAADKARADLARGA